MSADVAPAEVVSLAGLYRDLITEELASEEDRLDSLNDRAGSVQRNAVGMLTAIVAVLGFIGLGAGHLAVAPRWLIVCATVFTVVAVLWSVWGGWFVDDRGFGQAGREEIREGNSLVANLAKIGDARDVQLVRLRKQNDVKANRVQAAQIVSLVAGLCGVAAIIAAIW